MLTASHSKGTSYHRIDKSVRLSSIPDDLKQCALLFLIFVLIDFPLVKLFRNSATDYASTSPLVSSFNANNVVWLSILAMLFATLIYKGVLAVSWAALENSKTIKPFVIFLAVLITWFLTTLEFNHFFLQGYYLEKLALSVSLIMLVWRPFFILPWIVLAFFLLWQLQHPALNNGSHFPHKLQVLHVLVLFSAWVIMKTLTGRSSSRHFLFLTACLIAAAYWIPAFNKVLERWIYNGELYMMLYNAHAHGWLSFIEPSKYAPIVDSIGRLDIWLRIFVIFIEAGCLFIAFNRKFTVFLLLSLSVFHLGVFALYGYFFWTWISLNVAFVWLLLKLKNTPSAGFFTREYMAIGVVLILTARLWCYPSPLAWTDGRITYTYRYQATAEDGNQYQVPFSYFEPYGDVFTMANFNYLVDEHNFLAHPYGATSRKFANMLIAAETPTEVFDSEEKHGFNTYNSAKLDTFKDFLQTFIDNKNSRQTNATDKLYALSPPRQFWTHPRSVELDPHQKIKELTVKEITTFYDGEELREIREIDLLKLDF